MQLNTIEEIIDDIRQGKMVILMDDEDRENEGDLIMAADHVRPDDINFMATHARGLICLTLTEDRCRKLDLPLMVRDNRAQHSTNFTVSIEAAEGVTTGISAADRARTIQAAVSPDAQPQDIVQPGHIFPLMAQAGGVLSRAGHTEAGCDLARLAGREPAAVIVEIMNQDGSMARRPDLEAFAQEHDLKIGTIADLIHYRSVKEKTVERVNERNVDTVFGNFDLFTYRDLATRDLHFVLSKGHIDGDTPVPVRVHVLDIARDVLAILRESDKKIKPWSFHEALKYVEKEGAGVVVLICHNQASSEVEDAIDWLLSGKQPQASPDVVYRQIGTGAQMLRDVGVRKMKVMSAPLKFSAVSGFELEMTERLDCPTDSE
ncbi:bifunctional 3,4-dihydroxy-2-butanone-4-phosphate synthase/GTP cyclohydrolase II [Marinibactrum halimedae]|uniref:3,4-dihydroxy-2-butanone 4-phosphate synthase n=1 Tax=Marinibactrum halimedae TaxID=1444977 RepID=A0AA37TF26_9GAMM|nr:bifunctional 3,4-dihydroxy-2-butanone-4-phosphate synthase/GTP cyclohydrolase II [Marinibactrum halimedae]MCD9460519.1 3,4-dihydroxy-2-butanone-4-phosphate synthase [Marinibactrum halimedae]GLS27882.1 3,4-dihydroxy-2-butanone 4-phosphate synthase [Marinibactrum halimedae]